LSIQYKLIQAI